MSQNHRKQAARCGASALALVMGLSLAAGAHAQSFQAEGQVVNGAALLGGTATTTTVVVQTPQVVIDWTPFDTAGTGTINFQTAGTTATFSPDSIVLGDYTVLNRIVPVDTGGLVANRPVQFNGTVQSIGPNGPGGNIWFYSPTGIIAGATSAFNVGSLILTTNPIDTTQGLYGPAGEIRFRGVPGSTGFVNVLNGAQLNSQVADTGYIGIVSANVSQGGGVNANGAIAYVAAEQVDITFNTGLVDIQVTQGTTSTTGIAHTGFTGGPPSGGAGDRQTIAMVAVPKNTALTMLLSGTIGYDPAEQAINDGSAIILSAGQGLGFDTAPPVAAALGNINIGAAEFTSQLFATATDTIAVAPPAGSTTEFDNFASLNARRAVTLTAAPGSQIIANGNIEGQSLVATSGFGANGGAISLIAQSGGGLAAGGITAAAAVQLDASVSSAAASGSALASGGTITINAQGGTITAPQISADVVALGRGGGAGQPGGNAQAGTINVFASAGGSIATNQLFANARGVGGQGDDGDGPGVGGNGTGGAINVAAVGGTLTLQAPLQLDAGGDGGNGRLLGGNGTGGAIDLRTGGGGAITAPGTSVLTTSAGGGASPVVAGNGAGGSITVTDNLGLLAFQDLVLGSGGFGASSPATSGAGAGGRVAVTLQGQTQNWNTLTIDASSYGGLSFVAGSLGGGAAPRAGIASGAFLTVAGTGALNIVGDLQLDANATVAQNVAAGTTATAGQSGITVSGGGALNVGGALAARALTVFSEELPLGVPTITPVMQGGQASILANGGTIQAAGVFVNTSAFAAGASTTAGTATGGTTLLRASGGGAIRSIAGRGLPGEISVNADAYGATGPSPANALAGRAELSAIDGTITATGATLVSASALSSSDSFDLPGNGFATNGGSAFATIGGATGTAVLGFSTLSVVADANSSGGGAVITGNGGAATAGSALLQVASGALTANTSIIRAEGTGGIAAATTGPTAFTSGNGQGGSATLELLGGTAAPGSLAITAPGTGGSHNVLMIAAAGSTGSAGGTGIGGTATLQAASGTLSAGGTQILAYGFGGAGMGAATGGTPGAGGTGRGGTARWTTTPGGNALVSIPSQLTISASASGAAGGALDAEVVAAGGNGIGGSASVDLASGRFSVGNLLLVASGEGGNAPAPGSGTGGTARFALSDATTIAAPRTIALLDLNANGTGGSSSTTSGQSSAGAAVLTAQVGSSAAAISILGNFTATANGATAPAGNGFTGAFGGAPLTVGGSSNIQTTRDIAITLTAPGAFATQGTLTIATPRTITSGGTGVISSGGASSITGTLGVALANLQSGGTTLLAADNGALAVSALTSAGLVTARGRSINIASPAGLSFAPINATAGDLTITTVGNLALAAAGATGNTALTSSTGSLTATTVTAGGNASAAGQQGVTIATLQSGGATLLAADNGAVSVGALTSPGPVTARGRSVAIVSPGSLSFADADATAGNLAVTAAGNLALTTADATGVLALTSGGTLNASGAINGGSVALIAPTLIQVAGNITSGGTLQVQTNGAFSHTASAVSAGNASIAATQGIAITGLQSGGTTLLAADSGAVAVGALSSVGAVTARGRSVAIASPGSLAFADVDATAGDLSIATAGALTLATVDATGGANLTAGGGLTANGAVNAATIRAESADLVIGANGRLGARGVTGTVSLVNGSPANRTQIGGTAQSGAYSLDAGEASRIFADQGIDIGLRPAAIPAAGPGEVTLGDLALTYGATGNIGTGGFLRIATPGTARTTGAVLLTTSGDNDVFGITARRLEIVTNTGRIALRNGAGAARGRFNASADVLAVADSTALAAIDGVTDTRALTALLDQPGASANPEASLQAGTINLTVANRLLVQNSGASTEYADRRGFSANQLAITTGSASTVISINGQTFDAAGLASQGLDTVDTLLINGVRPAAGGSFDPFSTVNGCIIGQSCRFTLSTVPSLRRDEIDETLNMPNPPPAFLTTIELAEEADEPLKPLIDEPVTGVGNDDLWLRDCDPDDKQCIQAHPAP